MNINWSLIYFKTIFSDTFENGFETSQAFFFLNVVYILN